MTGKRGQIGEAVPHGILDGLLQQSIGTCLAETPPFNPARGDVALRQLSLDLGSQALVGQADDNLVRPQVSIERSDPIGNRFGLVRWTTDAFDLIIPNRDSCSRPGRW